MSAQEIALWAAGQPDEILKEFLEGIEYYWWGEDIPELGQFSTAFELGWQFARLQAMG